MAEDATSLRDSFRERGFALARSAVDTEELEALSRDVSRGLAEAPQSTRQAHGVRNLLSLAPGLAARLARPLYSLLAEEALGSPARLVKGTFFDKPVDANWGVPWHQDLTIVVAAEHGVEGFTNWSVKHGAVNVQAPASVLESIVALRIHLDDCPAENGALRVVPGSHSHGRLTSAHTSQLLSKHGEIICEARKGDVLLMSPLLLHSSSKSASPCHRRVIHLEYAGADLPAPLTWQFEFDSDRTAESTRREGCPN